MSARKLFLIASGLFAVMVLTGCVTNPVTGDKDLLVVSEAWELQVGQQQYAPLRQSQGGDYVVDPNVEAYVRKVGQRLAAKSDRKLPYEFNVINDSTPNAWALPGGKISINRGLLVRLKDESELAAVLGHEIVHAAAKHGARAQTRNLGMQLGVLTATVVGQRNGYGQLAQGLSAVGAQLINSRYGQGAELEADKFGMEYMKRAGYDPQGAVGLQKTFVELSKGRPNDPISKLFASHPPSEQRVRQNIATAASLGAGGQRGANEYQRAMSRLRQSAKAYDAFDKAQIAARKGDFTQANSLIRQAIRIEPREGHFQSFMGDLAQQRKDYRSAKQHYDKAISLNKEFFYYYLQRGKVLEATRNLQAARQDYATSMKYLPTSDAQASLGQFAERAGNLVAAKRFYAMAAQAQGAAGDKARSALQRLEPPVNKNTFLLVRQGLNQRGNFVIELVNQTSRPISYVKLGVTVAPGQRQQVQPVNAVIRAGKRHIVDTGQKVSQQRARQIQVVVLDATLAR